MELGIVSVAAITVICYLVGMCVKSTAIIKENFIPPICGAVGAILGVIGLYTMPDFPAADVLNAVAVVIVSGLAAVGVNQVGKQISKLEQ